MQGKKGIQTGKADPTQVQNDFKWFDNGYKNYRPDKAAINKLKATLPEYKIIIFAGTWCPDTQRILPAFYKAIDQAGYPRENTSLYLLDKKMRSAEKLEEKYQIYSVPTFILMKNNVETERIVENPKASIEADLAAILK
jgi:thiol-disulfide isomerase/thioredoxin